MMYPRRRRDVRRAYLCRGGRVRVDLARVRAGGTGRDRRACATRQGSGYTQHAARVGRGVVIHVRLALPLHIHTHTINLA